MVRRLQRLQDIEWTFSNTAEVATVAVFAIGFAAALLSKFV